MTEAKLQSEVIKYLKGRGCYVIKTKPGVGIPKGCPDVIFMLEGFWGAIECKTSRTATYQALQEETLEKFNEWSWAEAVYPENWQEVRAELEAIL